MTDRPGPTRRMMIGTAGAAAGLALAPLPLLAQTEHPNPMPEELRKVLERNPALPARWKHKGRLLAQLRLQGRPHRRASLKGAAGILMEIMRPPLFIAQETGQLADLLQAQPPILRLGLPRLGRIFHLQRGVFEIFSFNQRLQIMCRQL